MPIVRADVAGWKRVESLQILNRHHLEHVLRVYSDQYNRQTPHRLLTLRVPEPQQPRVRTSGAAIRRRGWLGGTRPRATIGPPLDGAGNGAFTPGARNLPRLRFAVAMLAVGCDLGAVRERPRPGPGPRAIGS